MSLIYQLPQSIPATEGMKPNFKFMVVGDDFSTVTAAGYLSFVNLEGFNVATTDVIQLLYNFNQQTQVGDYLACKVEISNLGVITLIPVNPIVSGVSSVFAGATTTFTFVANGVIEGAVLAVTLRSLTTAAYIVSAVSSADNSITVVFNIAPGANTVVQYIAYN